jgi:RNA polymerase sigma factor (sigma-70 family)
MVEDEEAIVARWVGARDAEAFRSIFVRYSTMVYATCRRILPNDHDAEEVAQECFETLAVTSSPPATYLGPWLHRVATNLSLKRIRSETRRHKREDRYVRDQATQSEAHWDDVYRFIDEAVAELPENFRAAVVARYLEAQTLESISRKLEVSPRTVAYRAEKGVTLIRRALRKRGITVGATSLATMMGANMAEAAVVPTALTAALGKLAVAGPSGSITFATAKTIGGLLVMKKVGIAALVLLGTVLAYWSVKNMSNESAPEAVGVSQSTQPTEASTSTGVEEPDEPLGGTKDADKAILTPLASPEPIPAVEPENTEENIDTMGASIFGVVRDVISMNGLEGVTVTATSGESVFDTKTDQDGRFQLAALTTGDYEVTSSVPQGYFLPEKADPVNVSLAEGRDRTGVEFAFQLGGTMEGVIKRGNVPAALERFEVSHNLGVEDSYGEYIETDDQGKYTLTGLIPGGRQVHFRSTAAVQQSNKIPVVVDAGKTVLVNVHFFAGSASIEGVVFRDERTPIAGKIEVHSLDHIFYATCGEDGHYIVEDLPAGAVQLLAFAGTDTNSDVPVQRKIFALELEEGDQLVQDIWFADTKVTCRVSNIPETSFETFVTALNGEVDFSVFNIMMLGTITRQRAAIGEVSVDGTGILKNLEPGTYTIAAISFPTNPSAIESLAGDELQFFIKNLAASNAETVTIEAATGEATVDLTFE